MADDQETRRPYPTDEVRFQAGTAWATVTRQRDSAHGRPDYRVRIQKRYFDNGDKQWKTSSYWRPDELAKLALVVQHAYAHTVLRVHNGGVPENATDRSTKCP